MYLFIVEMTKGSLTNYLTLHKKLMEQHSSSAHKAYPWEHWPKDDGRSECGYVGLTNLGATCYMATCVQQLYMIPGKWFLLVRKGKTVKEVEIYSSNPLGQSTLKKVLNYITSTQNYLAKYSQSWKVLISAFKNYL